MAWRAAPTMELRLKIAEGSDMFYTRADAENQRVGAMYVVDVAGMVGREDSVDRHSQSGSKTRQRQPPFVGGHRQPSTGPRSCHTIQSPARAAGGLRRDFSSIFDSPLRPSSACTAQTVCLR